MFVVPSLAALLSCDMGPRREVVPVAPIMLELEKCGIDLDKASFVARSDQQYVALKGHDQLSLQESSCIAAVLVPAKVGLRADNAATDEHYREAWEAVHRDFLAQLARDWFTEHRPDVELPKYQRAQPLEGYLRALEKACGAPRGTVLTDTQHKARFIWFAKENPGDPKTDCVDMAMSIGLENEDVGISRSQVYE